MQSSSTSGLMDYISQNTGCILKSKLKDVDEFRDIWLECCEHLSAFEIGGVRYYSEYFDFDLEPEARDMNIPLNKVLNPGMELL